MKTKYHIEITQNALRDWFSPEALQLIIKANIHQDRIKNQFGHDYIHFDTSAFEEGFQYIQDQERLIIKGVKLEDYLSSWEALGRLTHSWQDFYSHSNYVKLFMANSGITSPEAIQHDRLDILNHPDLRSGKNYGVIEYLALLPGIGKLVTPLMPDDSHARMNLDSPASSPLFGYVYWAAFKRTQNAIETILLKLIENHINQDKISNFMIKIVR